MKRSIRHPSLARWLFASFVLMIGSSQILMFGVVFYGEYQKGHKSSLKLLKQRVDFVLAKNEVGRLAGDYADLTRALYEISDTDAIVIMGKKCEILAASPLNAKLPGRCQQGEIVWPEWLYVPFDDPYSAVGGVGIKYRTNVWEEVWRPFLVSCLLFLFYAGLLSLILLVWLRRYFSRQIGNVVDSIRSLGRQGSFPPISEEKYPSELLPLYEAMTTTVRDLDEARRIVRAQSQMEAVAQIAAEVGHDIRSPLAALASMKNKISALSERDRGLIEGAISQIEKIADDLLCENRAARKSAQEASSSLTVAELSTELQSIVLEKRAEFQDCKGLEIGFRMGPMEPSTKVRLDAVELKRMISNLVNNSVEAIKGPGKIAVGLSSMGESVLIEVSDNGRGLSENELDRVWNRGESIGKTDGNAIGLTRAKQMAKLWGGSLRMQSQYGQGTVVIVELPKLSSVLSEGKVRDQLVLVDDDTLVRKSWKIAAEGRGLKLLVFSNADEFLHVSKNLNRSVKIYIDVNLGQGVDGVKLARHITALGFQEVYLCTGDPAHKFQDIEFLAGIVGKEFPDV